MNKILLSVMTNNKGNFFIFDGKKTIDNKEYTTLKEASIKMFFLCKKNSCYTNLYDLSENAYTKMIKGI